MKFSNDEIPLQKSWRLPPLRPPVQATPRTPQFHLSVRNFEFQTHFGISKYFLENKNYFGTSKFIFEVRVNFVISSLQNQIKFEFEMIIFRSIFKLFWTVIDTSIFGRNIFPKKFWLQRGSNPESLGSHFTTKPTRLSRR